MLCAVLSTRMVKSNYCLAYVLLLSLLCYCECRRSHGTGGRRGGHTTPRSNHYTTPNYQRPSEGSVGFERYQPSQNTRQDIGFENVQSRVPPNVQGGQPQYQTHYNPVSNSNPSVPNHNNNPSAPLPPANHNYNQQPGPGIGFENVNQRSPQHPYSQQPNNPYNSHPGNYNPSGHYNPPYNSYQPPQTYYNPSYSTPGGVSPQIYQPVQQSSGGSLLGYAGTFAGGALLGHLLTSSGGGGGGGGGSNDNGGQYSVHHYYHDANSIPKQMAVSTNSLMMCNKNGTEGLCVPNTFALCLSNGTIMCVTHSMYVTPCGAGSNLTCVITVLPCASNETSCNATTNGGNSTTTAVYIPCISNVTVSQQNLVTTDANSASNQNVKYCVTAIAEPKKLESPVASYANFLQEIAKMVYQMTAANSTTAPVITSVDQINKTEMTTLMPTALINENKTEITTLPYRM